MSTEFGYIAFIWNCCNCGHLNGSGNTIYCAQCSEHWCDSCKFTDRYTAEPTSLGYLTGAESRPETPPPSSYAEASGSSQFKATLEANGSGPGSPSPSPSSSSEEGEEEEEGELTELNDYPPLTEYKASFEAPPSFGIPPQGIQNWICCECGSHNCLTGVNPNCHCHEEDCEKCIYYGFAPAPRKKKQQKKKPASYDQLLEVLTQVLAEVAKVQ